MGVGLERFRWDPRILDEGYQRHFTGGERTRHFGRKSVKTKAYYRGRPKPRKKWGLRWRMRNPFRPRRRRRPTTTVKRGSKP